MIGPLTSHLIDACCPVEQRPVTIELLSTRASSAMPGVGTGAEWHDLIDRIQLAVIRGSQWQQSALENRIDRANVDFRDLLMAAGFEEVATHRQWQGQALLTCDIG